MILNCPCMFVLISIYLQFNPIKLYFIKEMLWTGLQFLLIKLICDTKYVTNIVSIILKKLFVGGVESNYFNQYQLRIFYQNFIISTWNLVHLFLHFIYFNKVIVNIFFYNVIVITYLLILLCFSDLSKLKMNTGKKLEFISKNGFKMFYVMGIESNYSKF